MFLPQNDFMETRRAFWAGVVVGALGMTILFGALVGLRKYENRKAAEQSIVTPADQLPPLQFPEVTALPNYGTANDEWYFATLDGQTTDLKNFRGKVVFLNFWATWCGDCAQELASIHDLEEKVRGEPVAFVLVSNEGPLRVRRFLSRLPFAPTSYVTHDKPPQVFATFELPTTYVINADGTIVYRHLGGARWNQEACVKFLRELAAKAPAKG
jgi:thiol-disulfide isomerase/thioredoxin